MRLVLDTHAGGVGDAIVLAWIAEGAKGGEHDIVFSESRPVERWATNAVLKLFGQPLVDEPGMELHGDGGFTKWNLLTVNRQRIDRTRLWQRRIGELFGVTLKIEPKRPTATIAPAVMKWANDIRAEHGRARFAVAFPYAAYDVRTWPAHKYRRLLYRLERDGWGTLALHTSEGKLSMFPRWAYGYTLEQTAALCRVADCVIGGGSGGVHLSGTLGTKTFAILGPDDGVISHGYSPETECLQVPKERLACSGCIYDPTMGFDGSCNYGCDALASLSWQEVYEAIQRWSDSRP